MMSPKDFEDCLSSLGIPNSHKKPAISNLISSNTTLQGLFLDKRLPVFPLPDHLIQHLLYTLSSLDTSTSKKWLEVGEGKGTSYASLVQNRNFGFSQGVDCNESQATSVGSTALARLSSALVLDVVRRGAGLRVPASNCNMVVPLNSDMSMSLVLSSLKKKVVLWCRVDDNPVAFKACFAAGMRVVVIPTKVDIDMVLTDLDALIEAIENEDADDVVIVSTTTCFAPRVPDAVDEIAKIAEEHDVAHVINHSYGLQCREMNKLVTTACGMGRVDAIILSMDKSFMVPVGGSIILSPKLQTIQTISKSYLGQANASLHIDLVITLLSMGMDGFKKLLSTRVNLMPKFRARFQQIAVNFGERMLHTSPDNTISCAMTLDHTTLFTPLQGETEQDYDSRVKREINQVGSMLFQRCMSGIKVIPPGTWRNVNGVDFRGYGSSTDDYTCGYLSIACTIFLSYEDMQYFFGRLEQVLKGANKYKRNHDDEEEEEDDEEDLSEGEEENE